MKTKGISILALLCVALFAAGGCKRKFTGTTRITAGNGARNVKLSVDGPAHVNTGPERITVTLPGHVMVIEKERLLLDKEERAKVPPDAKDFEIIGQGDTLTVNADGAEILKTPLEK